MRICVFGASTTYGTGDIEKGGWVDRLKVYLSKKDYKNQVYNLGIGGATSEMLLGRMECETKPRRPHLIIVGLGSNDSSYRRELGRNFVSPKDYKINLSKILKIAKKHTDKIIFIGSYPVDEKRTNPVSWNENVFYKNKDLLQYNEILKEFCSQNDTVFADIYKISLKKFLMDGVHINGAGHEKIFQIVKQCLIKNKLI